MFSYIRKIILYLLVVREKLIDYIGKEFNIIAR